MIRGFTPGCFSRARARVHVLGEVGIELTTKNTKGNQILTRVFVVHYEGMSDG